MQKACAKVLRHMSFQCVRNVRRGAGGRIPGWYLHISLSNVRTSSWPRSPPMLSAYWITLTLTLNPTLPYPILPYHTLPYPNPQLTNALHV